VSDAVYLDPRFKTDTAGSEPKRTKSEYNSPMPPPSKLTPLEVFDKLIRRLEKRVDALKRVKLDGFGPVIAELSEEIHFLNRGRDYIENSAETTRHRAL
jgi:hypothetical protein